MNTQSRLMMTPIARRLSQQGSVEEDSYPTHVTQVQHRSLHYLTLNLTQVQHTSQVQHKSVHYVTHKYNTSHSSTTQVSALSHTQVQNITLKYNTSHKYNTSQYNTSHSSTTQVQHTSHTSTTHDTQVQHRSISFSFFCPYWNYSL